MATYLDGAVVGLQFHPGAREVVDCIFNEPEVRLRREPNNPHDKNAVLVLIDHDELSQSAIDRASVNTQGDPPNPLPLGYLTRMDAMRAAPLLDVQKPDRVTLNCRKHPRVRIEWLSPSERGGGK